MVASYGFSERVNVQSVLWPAIVGVYRLLSALAAVCGWLYAQRAGLWAGVQVVAQVAGWGALIIGAVVVAVLYWYVLVAVCGIIVFAYVSYPRSEK